MTSSSQPADGTGTINRRRLLKVTGATAIGATAVSGVASAHEVTDGPVFCGCSQVCACGVGSADVIVATENGDGFSCTRVRQSFDFCYEVSEGKIIALDVVDGPTYCNPNENCAGKALADCDEITCTATGEKGGPCGKPPCEHPGRGKGPNGNDGRGNDR